MGHRTRVCQRQLIVVILARALFKMILPPPIEYY